jgi:toxin ParE1/3/4
MRYQILLTKSAEADLESIYDYILHHDSKANAQAVLDQLLTVVETLRHTPQRGTYPRELSSLGMYDYRQIFFKPYRVIYRVIEQQVFIMLIIDGRRDMESLLSHRLLS